MHGQRVQYHGLGMHAGQPNTSGLTMDRNSMASLRRQRWASKVENKLLMIFSIEFNKAYGFIIINNSMFLMFNIFSATKEKLKLKLLERNTLGKHWVINFCCQNKQNHKHGCYLHGGRRTIIPLGMYKQYLPGLGWSLVIFLSNFLFSAILNFFESFIVQIMHHLSGWMGVNDIHDLSPTLFSYTCK